MIEAITPFIEEEVAPVVEDPNYNYETPAVEESHYYEEVAPVAEEVVTEEYDY